MSQPINLAAAKLTVLAECGDDILIPLVVKDTNTLGWSLECPIYISNAAEDGPSGDPIGSGVVTNTPGSPDSNLMLRVSRDITGAQFRTSLFGRLRNTYDGSVRTLLETVLKIQ